MKLHLGCGARYIPGFVHIDAVDFPHVDHQSAIDRLPFIPDGSVELVYACHVLEHFKRSVVGEVLAEWRRVLRPGGVLRLAVPDFAALCKVYGETGRLDLVIGALYGRQNHLYNIHYNTFDEGTLRALLEQVGFDGAARYDWRATEHADVDDFSQAYLPHLDREHGTLISLNMEARRRA